MSEYYATERLRLIDQLAELNRQAILTQVQLEVLQRMVIYQRKYKKRPLSLPEKMVDSGLLKLEQMISRMVASVIKVRQ